MLAIAVVSCIILIKILLDNCLVLLDPAARLHHVNVKRGVTYIHARRMLLADPGQIELSFTLQIAHVLCSHFLQILTRNV